METLAWVDTAFNGSLVLPNSLAKDLGLAVESCVEAVLADGNIVELESHGCRIEWFGKAYNTQAMTNDSKYALLGTIMLDGHMLTIDYASKTVSLRPSA